MRGGVEGDFVHGTPRRNEAPPVTQRSQAHSRKGRLSSREGSPLARRLCTPERVVFPVGRETHKRDIYNRVVVDEGAQALGEGIFRFDGVLQILQHTKCHIDMTFRELGLSRETESRTVRH